MISIDLMIDVLLQVVIPFILSALIVIIVMFIAERYGTKTGGIFGTLPSTIVIAFIFIAINQGLDFASQSAGVVPAELGINIIFLFVFSISILVYRSTFLSISCSLISWTFLSFLLYIFNMNNIYISLAIFLISLVFTFIVLERVTKIPSLGKVQVHYTTKKMLFRGLLAGVVIAISVLLSNFNPVLSGIFSVFPAILTSTMLISVRDHGPEFAAGMAKSMIFGISSVCIYATVIYFLYPIYGIIFGTIFAYGFSLVATMILFKLRGKIL